MYILTENKLFWKVAYFVLFHFAKKDTANLFSGLSFSSKYQQSITHVCLGIFQNMFQVFSMLTLILPFPCLWSFYKSHSKSSVISKRISYTSHKES